MRTESIILLKRPLSCVDLAAPETAAATEVPDTGPSLEAQWAARMAEEGAAIQQLLERLTEAVQQLDERKQQLLGEMQQVAVELAIAVASRVVHERIEQGQFAVENLVKSTVQLLGARRGAKVRLNPQDAELLSSRLGQPLVVPECGPLELVADATVARGSCTVETDDVSIVSQIEPQLAELRRHLLGRLEHAEVERRKTQAGDRNLRRFPDRRQTA